VTTSQASNANSMTQSDVRWITSSLRRAVSLGLAAGLGEAAIRLAWHYLGGRMQIHTGLDIVWMAPLANAVVFAAVALGIVAVLALTGQRVSALTKVALVTGALVALAVWSLTERVPQISSRAGAILGLGSGVAALGASRRRGASRTIIDRALIPLGSTVVILCGALVATAALRERRALGALPAADANAPNVLLLILDTVRAQSTSLYGYARRTTPVLDALADSGVRFERAFSTAPWTLPSHASVFTGRYPHELSADWVSPLDKADLVLAERFRDAGYVTGGFVGNYMVSHEVGVARGFTHYEDFQRDVRQLAMSSSLTVWVLHWTRLRRAIHWYNHVNRRDADALNAGVVHWVRSRGARPYFAFVNYFDAHEFYLPPAPFATMFGPDSARKNWLMGFSMPNGGLTFRKGKASMKPHEVQAERDAYEAAIAYVDSRIGMLLDSLATARALDNTIVIVTSDHGEHFGEHGAFDHGATLYPQVLHVPLLITARGRVPAGKRIADFVTLRDVAATIEHLALGTKKLPGTPLDVYWDTDSTTRSTSPILSSRTLSTRDVIPDSVRHGAWSAIIDDKLIIEFVGGRQPGTEVFDLRADSLATHAIEPGNAPNVKVALDSAHRMYRVFHWKSRRAAAARVSATAAGSR
jgi:arylsulfatase A-like enzyme